MPTIIKQDGFRIVIWPNDHLPPHAHVFKSDAQVKIELVEPTVSKVEGTISNKDLAKALNLVIEHQALTVRKMEGNS